MEGRHSVDKSELWRRVAVAEQLIESAHVSGMAGEEGRLRLGLGGCYYLLGQDEEAVHALEQALPVLRATGNDHGVSQALCTLGVALVRLERVRQAIPVLKEGLQLARSTGAEVEELECLS